MTSLQLYVMTAFKKVRKEPFQFTAEDDAATADASPRQLEFRSTRLIYEGDTCVYRGVLIGHDSREIKAVCKLGLRAYPESDVLQAYHHEAETYRTTLSDMQGHYIPSFYGLYVGTVFRDPAVCIILEDCGDPVGSFGNLSDDLSTKAIEILMAIHDRGLQHNDFSARNIVVNNATDPPRLVLVDFEHTTPHECERELDIALHQLPPSYDEFNCDELYRAAEAICVWTPSSVLAFGCYVPVGAFAKAEDLLKQVPWWESRYTHEDALLRAQVAIHEYFSAWGYRRDHVLRNTYKALSPAM